MYPQLMAASQRLAPLLSRLAARGGSFATPLWKASQVDAPEVSPTGQAPAPAPTGPSPPISGVTPGWRDEPAKPAAPSGPQANPANWGLGPFFMSAPGAGTSWKDSTNYPTPASPAAAPQQTASPEAGPQGPSVPMPMARPAEAPQAQPDTSFFMRNALSMRDPSTGELIDPSGASSVSGPDLISKMMTYLHNKA